MTFFSSSRTVPTRPSRQSRRGSILHIQLMLASLPISLDLIEVAEFAYRGARLVLSLRILFVFDVDPSVERSWQIDPPALYGANERG